MDSTFHAALWSLSLARLSGLQNRRRVLEVDGFVAGSDSFRVVPGGSHSSAISASIEEDSHPWPARKKRAPSSHRRAWKNHLSLPPKDIVLSSTPAEVLGVVPGDSLNVKVL
jgi:hypothetical protein